MILYLFQGVTLGFYATIVPGPFQVFLLSHALKNGWRRTLPAVLAPLVTDGPILLLFLILLTRAPQWLLDAFHIAGGLFILFLAFGILKSIKKPSLIPEPDAKAARKGFINAVAICGLNPNAYIFWSLLGAPILLAGWRESAILGITFLAAFFGAYVCSLVVLIVMFATAGRINPIINRTLNIIAFCALLVFGLYQIISGIMTLL